MSHPPIHPSICRNTRCARESAVSSESAQRGTRQRQVLPMCARLGAATATGIGGSAPTGASAGLFFQTRHPSQQTTSKKTSNASNKKNSDEKGVTCSTQHINTYFYTKKSEHKVALQQQRAVSRRAIKFMVFFDERTTHVRAAYTAVSALQDRQDILMCTIFNGLVAGYHACTTVAAP